MLLHLEPQPHISVEPVTYHIDDRNDFEISMNDWLHVDGQQFNLEYYTYKIVEEPYPISEYVT